MTNPLRLGIVDNKGALRPERTGEDHPMFAGALRRGILAIAMLAVLTPPAAQAASEAQDLIDRAQLTLNDVKRDPAFGTTQQLLKRAVGVLIVPALFKGGFFVGGEGGTGIFLVRDGKASWSNPAFYTLASGSFGLQIGAEESELVLIVLTEKGKQSFMSNEFKIGVEAGIAVVTLGTAAEAATTSNLTADIVVWASSTGAYAGLTLNGSVIKPRDSYNEAFYGKAVSPADILTRRAVVSPEADSLRKTLASMS